ncbi:MAG: hypothetical protein GC191_17670 [Azospirillum sp.]|nr:hypothetical protein [Azospirillum sp.]
MKFIDNKLWRFCIRNRTVVIPLFAAFVFLTGFGEFGVKLLGVSALDQRATTEIHAAATRSVELFVAARVINAAISVVKEITVGGSAVATLQLQPGQLLDPIDKLIEQFANIVLFVGVASVLSEMLVRFGLYAWILQAVLPIGLILVALSQVEALAPRRSFRSDILMKAGLSIGIVALFIRIGLPASFVISDTLTESAIGSSVEESYSKLNELSQQIQIHTKEIDLQSDRKDEPQGLLGSASSALDDLWKSGKNTYHFLNDVKRFIADHSDELFSALSVIIAHAILNSIFLLCTLFVAYKTLRTSLQAALLPTTKVIERASVERA